jgi:hypothetical protein
MRQDKDRSGKWLLTHHGDSVLKLAGLTGFTAWKALQPETVAPRRLPDGLLEVRFPGETEPTLVLVEIETYPDADADRQVLDDVMLIAVDRKVVPEVVSIVLKPKGNLDVIGRVEKASSRGRTRVGGSWPVVRLWELDAETLLSAGDAGFVPWVPLTRSTLSPEELMVRVRDRLVAVSDPTDRAGLVVVTQILADLAFPGKKFLHLFGGPQMMIDSPVLDEVKEILRKRYEEEATLRTLRGAVVSNLEARFGAVPTERVAGLATVTQESRLQALLRLAATCPDLDTFVAALTAG